MTVFDLQAHLLALEVSLHRTETRRSHAVLERLLAPEFTEFGRSGRVYDRAAVIEALLNEFADPADLPRVSDVSCLPLSADCALLTYRTSRGAAPVETLRSSVWMQRDGRWSMIFHQGTPA